MNRDCVLVKYRTHVVYQIILEINYQEVKVCSYIIN